MLTLCWGHRFVVFDSLYGPKDIPMGTFRNFFFKYMYSEKCKLVYTWPQIILKLVQPIQC